MEVTVFSSITVIFTIYEPCRFVDFNFVDLARPSLSTLSKVVYACLFHCLRLGFSFCLELLFDNKIQIIPLYIDSLNWNLRSLKVRTMHCSPPRLLFLQQCLGHGTQILIE